MNLQLQMKRGIHTPSIEIAFGKHFILPVLLLTVLIIGSSVLVSEGTVASHSSYNGQKIIDSESAQHLRLQIANLEGESQRLKAFAKKMVGLAKLDKNIFNFDELPARGGLGGRNIFQRFTVSTTALNRDIGSLKQQLLKQSNQLERMQLVLKSRILGESEKQSRWPVSNAYISSRYGWRKDPFNGRLRRHRGIDLAGPRGADVFSIATGKVVFAARKGGYGKLVEVKHANGFASRYAHLDSITVEKGQQVIVGEKIGLLGSTGRSTGPHLHLEILKNHKNIDPLLFLGKQK